MYLIILLFDIQEKAGVFGGMFKKNTKLSQVSFLDMTAQLWLKFANQITMLILLLLTSTTSKFKLNFI